MSADLSRILDRAKIGLMQQKPAVFLSTVLFSLHHHWDESTSTAATDGISLWINPTWFAELTEKERIGLLAHEAWHVAFQHMLRLKERDHRVWNYACDYVINLMLVDAGYTLPEGGLLERKYEGMSSEEVYDLLIDNQQDQPNSFKMQDLKDPEKSNKNSSAEETAQRINRTLIKAATQAKMTGKKDEYGSIPGDIQRMLDNLLNPILPWNVVLQNYVSQFKPEDFSFRRPNRRFMPDHYLPTLDGEGMDSLAVAIDTSGSVTEKMFKDFVTEVHGMRETCNPNTTTVLPFDTAIKAENVLEKEDSIAQVEFLGGGGTRIEPVIDWAKKHRPTVLLVFTDGHFRRYPEDPGCPVIWVIYDNPGFSYPYGRVIEYPS